MDAIVTPEQMAVIDRSAPEPVEVLIERAGAAVARVALDMLGGAYGRRVTVVAGPGNNGADGRAAARRLTARGVRCRVIDARALPPSLPAADLVIDAAFGTGFRGSYRSPRSERATPVLAVDIPSGVDGLTGVASGSPLPADRTVTFAALKPGLLLADGPGLAGELTVTDIGLDVTGARAHRVDDLFVSHWLPHRRRDTHKWKAAVTVVAGSVGMDGAAHLTARAAQRAGAGYVRLGTPGLGHLPGAPIEAVVGPLPVEGWADVVMEDIERFAALAVGPGLGRSVVNAEGVRALVGRTTVPVVVDGDGLRALSPSTQPIDRSDGAGPVVLTPHDGEFAAMTGAPPGPDRFTEVRTLSRRTGATVLLKGPVTLVAEPGGRVLAVTSGDARLATAGTGDVLTGIVVALLTHVGHDDRTAVEAAAVAAHLHGRAGALAWPQGLVAGDLSDHLPALLTQLHGG